MSIAAKEVTTDSHPQGQPPYRRQGRRGWWPMRWRMGHQAALLTETAWGRFWQVWYLEVATGGWAALFDREVPLADEEEVPSASRTASARTAPQESGPSPGARTS